MENAQHLLEVKAAIDASEKTVGKWFVKRDEEIKAHGAATEKTAKTLDDHVTAWESQKAEYVEGLEALRTEHGKELDGIKADHAASQKLIEELQEEAKASKRPGWGGEVPDELKSVGERYTESTEFKSTL